VDDSNCDYCATESLNVQSNQSPNWLTQPGTDREHNCVIIIADNLVED